MNLAKPPLAFNLLGLFFPNFFLFSIGINPYINIK